MARGRPPTVESLYLAELEWQANQERERQREIQAAKTAAELEVMRASQASDIWRIYRDDPVAWAHDMIAWREGEGLAEYQEEILAALPIYKRVCFRGPHVIGKSTTMSIALLWFALTRDGDDWKIPTTASVSRQLTKFLWPEIRKWSRRLRWDKIGRDPFDRRTEMQMFNLKLSTGEAFAMASDTPESMEGAHADRMLGIFDESKAIPDQTFDALEGAFAGTGETMALAGSTPGEPIGRFHAIQTRKPGTEDWHVIVVTKERAIKAGRMSEAWAEQRAKQWGEESAVYKNRVLGDFAQSDEDSIIPLAWVEAAVERWRAVMEPPDATTGTWVPELPAFIGVGADVGSGSSKSDKTVFATRHGDIITELRRFEHADTMQTAGRLKGILDANGGYAVVDVIGIGTGVVDRLREQKKTVYGFVAGASSDKKDRSGELGYADKRSEAWWTLREMLDPAYNPTLALPPDDTLIGDLTAPKSRIMSGAKIKVESKDELRKPERLGRSTDDGDAVVQIIWTPAEPKKIAAPRGVKRAGGRSTWRRDG